MHYKVMENSISSAFSNVLSDSDEILVIHSSLFAFRIPELELKWPLLQVLRRFIRQGYTIVLPAFTFRFCQTGYFDLDVAKSETGLLSAWALSLKEFSRTRHPIYSFVVGGPRAREIRDCQSETCWDDTSPFGLFNVLNARIVVFGCSWEFCTQFHYYEEAAQVPYREYKVFNGNTSDGEFVSARMFVRNQQINAENNFSAILATLRAEKKIASANLGEGCVESVACDDLGAVCRRALSNDLFSLVANSPNINLKTRMMAEKYSNEPMKIAVLGMANVEILCQKLEKALTKLLPNRQIISYRADFGQAMREAVDEGSGFDKFDPDFVFFVDRLEDLHGKATLDAVQVLDEVNLSFYIETIKATASRTRTQVFVNTFADLNINALECSDRLDVNGPASLVAKANALVAAQISGLEGVYTVDINKIAIAFHEGSPTDLRLWFLGRIPFSQNFTDRLANKFSALVAAVTGRTVRLLILDLDNTLWAGVLGEEGPDGIALGGDFPGNAFYHFQCVLKQLAARGIALALVSKNDEKEALDIIDNHPEMVLRRDDFAAWRIGWEDKPSSIIEIAEELSLGLENIAFVDDNPAERMAVRLSLPEVKVIDLPSDPSTFATVLLSTPWLECAKLTMEDFSRSSGYVRARKMRTAQQKFDDHGKFISYLAPRVHIQCLNRFNISRATQLIAKTNQFNTTCQRFSQTELTSLNTGGSTVFIIGLQDRFSELENIGCAIISWNKPAKRWATIELLLLSCRVLGRGVESGFMSWLSSHAKKRSMERLVGLIAHAPRNEPARNVYCSHGFSEGDKAGEWVCDLDEVTIAAPDGVEVVDSVEDLTDA